MNDFVVSNCSFFYISCFMKMRSLKILIRILKSFPKVPSGLSSFMPEALLNCLMVLVCPLIFESKVLIRKLIGIKVGILTGEFPCKGI